jgi:hypothetical protein
MLRVLGTTEIPMPNRIVGRRMAWRKMAPSWQALFVPFVLRQLGVRERLLPPPSYRNCVTGRPTPRCISSLDAVPPSTNWLSIATSRLRGRAGQSRCSGTALAVAVCFGTRPACAATHHDGFDRAAVRLPLRACATLETGHSIEQCSGHRSSFGRVWCCGDTRHGRICLRSSRACGRQYRYPAPSAGFHQWPAPRETFCRNG